VNQKITFSQALEGYRIHAHSRRLSPNTMNDYNHTFRKFAAYLAADPPLVQITADDIEGFLATQEHLSKKTISNLHTGLSALWTWAVGRRIVGEHIVRQVRPPKPKEKVIEIFTEAAVQTLLNACDRAQSYQRPGQRKCSNSRPTALRDKAIILTLLDSMVRITELCQMRVSLMDARTGSTKIIKAKGDKERIVPISSETHELIWQYHASRPVPKPKYQDYVFLTQGGRPLDKDIIGKMLRRLGRRAGIKTNAHKFRHTGATEFIRNGGDAFALQKILGHSTMAMVQRYIHLAKVDIESAHRHASPVYNWDLRT
jgi:site-specific recombinase XerD